MYTRQEQALALQVVGRGLAPCVTFTFYCHYIDFRKEVSGYDSIRRTCDGWRFQAQTA